MEEFIARVVSNIGVPAALCFYTLFGINKTLQKQDVTLKELAEAIKDLTVDVKKIEKLEGQVRELAYKVEKLQSEISIKTAQMHCKE